MKVTFDAAAFLAEETADCRRPKRSATARLDQKPYWHLERSRIGDSRKVPVEVIVNGTAGGDEEDCRRRQTAEPEFRRSDCQQSSWIAVRIFPSVHTNPVFVEVARQTDPRQPQERRMVPKGGRRLLEREGGTDSQKRTRGRESRLRRGPHLLRARPGRKCR